MNETEKQIRDKMEQAAKQAEKLLPDLNSENTAKREAARAQHAAFIVEFDELETQLENIMSQENSLTFTDQGERTEIAAIRDRVSLRDWLAPAVNSGFVQGAAKEFNSAMGLPIDQQHVELPWNMLLSPQQRAATTTTQLSGSDMVQPVLERLFEDSLLPFMGVDIRSVPYGKHTYPLVTAGATAAAVAEGSAAADPSAATFKKVTLEQNRLHARMAVTMELITEYGPSVESALRMDMMNSIDSLMSDQILSGDGTDPNITGLQTRLAVPNPDATAVVTFADLVSMASQGVDAVHATMPSQVRALIGTASLTKFESLQKDGVSESGYEVLMRKSGGVRVSARVAAVPDTGADRAGIQDVFLYSAGMGMRSGDSIAAVWPNIQLIRDNVTGAKSGTVQLHACVMWDAYMAYREGAYKRLAVKLK